MNSPNEIQFNDVLSIPSNPEDLFTLLYSIDIGSFGKVYTYYSRKSNTDIFGLLVGFAISIIVKLYINHSNFLGAVFSTHHNTSNYAILIQVMGPFFYTIF